MKSILLSNRPEETSKLLNGDLSVLVRRKFPKDFVGWVEVLFWLTLPLNIIIHFIIDNAKANKHKIDLITDQLLHFLQISITWAYFCLLILF